MNQEEAAEKSRAVTMAPESQHTLGELYDYVLRQIDNGQIRESNLAIGARAEAEMQAGKPGLATIIRFTQEPLHQLPALEEMESFPGMDTIMRDAIQKRTVWHDLNYLDDLRKDLAVAGKCKRVEEVDSIPLTLIAKLLRPEKCPAPQLPAVEPGIKQASNPISTLDTLLETLLERSSRQISEGTSAIDLRKLADEKNAAAANVGWPHLGLECISWLVGHSVKEDDVRACIRDAKESIDWLLAFWGPVGNRRGILQSAIPVTREYSPEEFDAAALRFSPVSRRAQDVQEKLAELYASAVAPKARLEGKPPTAESEADDESEADGSTQRMTVEEANEKAKQLVKAMKRGFLVSYRKQANLIGCSFATWRKAPFFYVVNKNRLLAEKSKPKGERKSSAFTPAIEATIGVGKPGEVVNRLAEEELAERQRKKDLEQVLNEHDGDFEPSPLDGDAPRKSRPRQ